MEREEQSIYGLFFEIQPRPGQRQVYFDHVDKLKPVLSEHDGLLWIQRYQSIEVPELIFSHQYWSSEAALVTWRRNQHHRYSQIQGMKRIFADYRIRVGPRIWSSNSGGQLRELPSNQNSDQKCILTLQKSDGNDVELNDANVTLTSRYASLTSEDQGQIIFSCNGFTEGLLPKILQSGVRRADLFLPNRDYGMYDRSGSKL